MLSRMWRRKHSSAAGGSVNLNIYFGINMAVSQKIGTWSSLRRSSTTPGHVPNTPFYHKNACSTVDSSFILIVRNWRQPRCPSTVSDPLLFQDILVCKHLNFFLSEQTLLWALSLSVLTIFTKPSTFLKSSKIQAIKHKYPKVRIFYIKGRNYYI